MNIETKIQSIPIFILFVNIKKIFINFYIYIYVIITHCVCVCIGRLELIVIYYILYLYTCFMLQKCLYELIF